VNQIISDLDILARSYRNRALANGEGHPDSPYLWGQVQRFADAAVALRFAVEAAAIQAARPLVSV
jgi:hypothetical protein